jgi:hypothetical protein
MRPGDLPRCMLLRHQRKLQRSVPTPVRVLALLNKYELYELFWSERRMECELIRRKDRSELAPTCTAPGETMHAGTTLIP